MSSTRSGCCSGAAVGARRRSCDGRHVREAGAGSSGTVRGLLCGGGGRQSAHEQTLYFASQHIAKRGHIYDRRSLFDPKRTEERNK
eukprot:SAG11_NODE_130_length_15497_cov_10.780556_10_plen_86_part_00